MDTGAELLPKPPFDLEQEALVTSSVELSADRLQSMVAWLVTCIRDNQQRIMRNERRLSELGRIAGTSTVSDPLPGEQAPAGSVGGSPVQLGEQERTGSAGTGFLGMQLGDELLPGSQVAPSQDVERPTSAPGAPFPASVTSALQSSIREEVLLMQINSVKQQVNSAAKMTDLERQRERMSAELASFSEDVNARQRDGQEKVEGLLATATENLRAQLERICNDVLGRLETIESRTDAAEAAAKSAQNAATAVRTENSSARYSVAPVSSGTPGTSAAAYEQLHQRRINEDSPAATADSAADAADAGSAATRASQVRLPDDALGNTGDRGIPQSPGAAPSRGTPPASRGSPVQSRRRANFGADGGTSQPGNMRVGVTVLAGAEPPPDTPPTSDAFSPSRARGDNAANTRASAGGVYSVVTDPTMFDFAAQVSDLRSITERHWNEIDAVKIDTNNDLKEMKNLMEKLDDAIHFQGTQIERIEMDMSEMARRTPAEEKARREWFNQAAASRKDRREGDPSPSERSLDRRRSASSRHSPTASRSSSRAVSPKIFSSRDRSSPQHAELGGAEGNAQLAERLDAIEDSHLPDLQDEIVTRTDDLEGQISDVFKLLMPDKAPSLADQVKNVQDSFGEMEKWQGKMEKKMRRLAPLDSQWADVQEELERFRKLFEFLQGLIPSESAEAMRFFNRRFEEQKQANKDAARNAMFADVEPAGDAKSNPTFVSKLAEPLGPEVALDRHRAALEEEVKNYEQQMRNEFSNLSLAIKAQQRETGQIGNKMVDLLTRLNRVEGGDRAPTPADQGAESRRVLIPATEGSKAAAVAGKPADEPNADDATSWSLTKVPGSPPETASEPAGEDVDSAEYVSKGSMNKALENCKEDFRGWLDVLHEQIIQALQQKADNNQVNNIIQRLSQAVGIETEQFAMLAKRALQGRCLSCDAQLSLNDNTFKRPVPVSSPPPWAAKPPAGAPITMRPPGVLSAGGNQDKLFTSLSAGKLPKIKNAADAKEQKGRILKNSSQPDLRKWKLAEPERAVDAKSTVP